jgi:sulfoxide reductase catalytic subunit YedY
MIPFDQAHRAVHYPPDRRFRIWIRPSVLAVLILLVLVPLVLAWIEAAIFGMPYIASSSASIEGTMSGPHGFPV